MKILIRAGMLPTETFDYIEMIQRNILGSNVGNLVYQYSVCRALMTKEIDGFIPTRYRFHFSEEEIAEYNETCACYIIPLADAFRESFMPELRSITKLVKNLKIPCHVIGVGLKAPKNVEDLHFGFDQDVKDFVSAVLEKSGMLGLRGQITADYLEGLGFLPEKDFTVIGCPSLYMYPELSVRETPVTESSDIAYNISPGANAETIAFIRTNTARFHSACYIPQNVEDLKIVYGGVVRRDGCADFPKILSDPVFDNAAFPGSVTAWKHLLQTKEFSFGTRLHGNIMGVLSGIPTIHIPFDARTSELVDYHQLVYADTEEIRQCGDIFELIAKADFQKPVRAQKRNFEHYIDFLNKNEIRHIYLPDEEPVLDQVLAEMSLQEPLRPIRCTSAEEAVRRSVTYSSYADKWIVDQRNRNKKQKDEITALREELKNTRKELKDAKKELKNANKELQNTGKELKNTYEQLAEKEEQLANLEKKGFRRRVKKP